VTTAVVKKKPRRVQRPLTGELQKDTRETWDYHFGVPDRSGLAQYTHLIRHETDPEETLARGSAEDGRDSTHWAKIDKSPEAWATKILELLSDGKARTFNRICVTLTGTTADVWAGKPPDDGLWLLVERYQVVYAQEHGVIWFLSRTALISEEPEVSDEGWQERRAFDV
jgi:hypothetical protein